MLEELTNLIKKNKQEHVENATKKKQAVLAVIHQNIKISMK